MKQVFLLHSELAKNLTAIKRTFTSSAKKVQGGGNLVEKAYFYNMTSQVSRTNRVVDTDTTPSKKIVDEVQSGR